MTAVCRLAPSPTGAQHLGNARTYLLAWLSARSRNAEIQLRIEDIDSPRTKPGAQQQVLEDLTWMGLDWDTGPIIQTQRLDRYREVFAELQRRELVYPCTCTRSDIAAAASAPHAGQEGPIYPGTCANRSAGDEHALGSTPYAWRFRVAACPQMATGPVAAEWTSTLPTAPVTFQDLVAGPQACDVPRELGDFVIVKHDGTPAYQLAVVVDDHDFGVTEVVRGDDLIPSTFRQLLLYQTFGWTPPEFAHVPLVVGPDGRRLAKRHGDTRISLLRESGIPAARLIGWLAWTCGLQDSPEPVTPQALVNRHRWDRLPREPVCCTSETWHMLSCP